MKLALFQPDIAGNVGAIARLAACWSIPLDIILPCGFAWSDRQFRRAAMDYGVAAEIQRHTDFDAFAADRLASGERLIALSSAGDQILHDFAFRDSDVLLMGRESAGLPGWLHDRADARIKIPMAPGMRSLNLGMAAGIALGEARRQTGGVPA